MTDATHAGSPAAGGEMAHLMVVFVLQLAVILIAARSTGFVFRRWLRMPSVLGELTAGMLIGPYALGGLAIGGLPPLFSTLDSGFPVSAELYALATLASIVLLFLAGLETDLVAFLRYSAAGSLVGVGGVVFSFLVGAGCAILFNICDSLMDPAALFLGSAATATSVGITARILGEKQKYDSPEGVTILSAAVVDDVLCIIMLAVAIGLSGRAVSGQVPWADIGVIASRAILFWLASMAMSMATAPFISRVLKQSGSHEVMATLSLGLALFLAGLSEMAGLAMIIGAYVSGLAFSRTDLVEVIQEELHGLYESVVPVFFCVMGMLVDFRAMQGAIWFGLTYTALCVLSKVLGCALPAYLTKFNLLGSLRVGVGMLPRGEVALIVAGVGLSSGALDSSVFGVAVMMTAVTTLLAPPILSSMLHDGSGLKPRASTGMEAPVEVIHLPMPAPELADLIAERIVRAFRREEFFVHRLSIDEPTHRFRKDNMMVTLRVQDCVVHLLSAPDYADIVRFIALEELLELESMHTACEKLKDMSSLHRQLLNGE